MFLFFRQACDKLLLQRVEMKMKGRKVTDVLNRLHVAVPKQRDAKVCTFCAASFRNVFPVSLSPLCFADLSKETCNWLPSQHW